MILTIGVSVVNLSKGVEETTNTDSHFLGMLAVFCASCTSGFSGVYFEKILKGSTINLWIRNIQMGLPSIFLALGAIYVNDYAIVKEKGFFVGYSPSVWAVVIIQAVGGVDCCTCCKVCRQCTQSICDIIQYNSFLYHIRSLF